MIFGGIVRNDSGEVLLQNKGNGEKWSLPAGAIEPGEAPAEAIVREVREETGLYVSNIDFQKFFS
ncbi:NUDIX domain-containing protein [Paenibacillus sp. 1P03SA]